MRPPETIYRGTRSGGGVRPITVTVTVDGQPLSLPQQLDFDYGFEWGYGGAGPAKLALALLLDATSDQALSLKCFTWFKWATVSQWGQRWQITAGEIRNWVMRWEREGNRGGNLKSAPADDQSAWVPRGCVAVRRCRGCGCTDDDCRQCIAITGRPCSWVAGDPNLCTRCAAEAVPGTVVAVKGGVA